MSESAGGARGAVQRLFDRTRARLVETGTRNRLVHVNRANTRGHVVNIVNERSDDVHAILCGGRAMRFRALGHDRPDTGEVVLAEEGEEEVGADRWTDAWLETRLGPDALAKKLLKIAGEARTAEEEQGVNILYLALGFLTWFEDKSSAVPREAPLVLLPVELTRNQRTSSYDLRLRDEDLLTNLPLQQRLRDDYGIALPPIVPGEGWRPSDYHAAVEAMIADRPRWRVDRDAMQLGFFSFSKLLMYLDLSLDAWPDGALEAHGLTRGLLYEGFDRESPLFGPGDRLDAVLPPERMAHVVDADASQATVIEEVRLGRNLVVQGPPGTGKSQTITNMIATAAKEGKTVLFVAEKMAALSVVHDRLVKVGLGDVCLELHSRTANKKAVLGELARTLNAAGAAPAIPVPPTTLTEARDRLNAIAEALHRPIGDTGETPFSVLARQVRYLGQGAPSPTLEAAELAKLDRAGERGLTDAVRRFADLVALAGPPHDHPLAGVGALDLQPVALARLEPQLADARAAAARLREALDAALAAAGLPDEPSLGRAAPLIDALARLDGLPPGGGASARRLFDVTDRVRLTEALASAERWREARAAADPLFTEAAFGTGADQWRGGLVPGTQSWWARWFSSAYRASSRALSAMLRQPSPDAAGERLALLDQLLEVQALRRRWDEDEPFLQNALGPEWRGERTDFAAHASVAAWVARAEGGTVAITPDRRVDLAADPARIRALREALASAEPPARAALHQVGEVLELDPAQLGDEADLASTEAKLATIGASLDRYDEWARLRTLRGRVDAAGLQSLADRVASGALSGEAAVAELRFARAERLWTDAVRADPALREAGALDRHALAERFAGLERARLKENVTAILAQHLAQVPQGALGEMRIVRGEIGKKRGHLALRKLFATAPTALQRIKPVLLMSPISVAQYLTPGTLKFDLLIIDEASQVRPEDALGAIARAGQIVVVGDQKQLPPTSFFDRLLADGEAADEPEAEEEDLLGGAAALGSLESVLSLCEARGLPGRMLQWHYRSRDPSLIRVSNREFYRDELILPPSPLERDPAFGLTFTRVDGAYDKGGKRDNRIEGEAIVRRLAEHARTHPALSLGVVTFSAAQKNAITELLELARRTDPALDAFLREGQAEDVFVKNIENVQGDERDVILVSVGYGPATPGGRLLAMSFGPVNGEGGERRLNVLFTRARVRCEVFASFDPADIDAARTSREGPRILKRFLQFAQSGKLDEAVVTGEPPDTPFEEDVADVIRSFGYLADPQVGSAGFRIDLGVRHPDKPGAYLLAVECDGATYHSALWARERDRLRQDVLEHLGWRFHRVWSTDWFHRRRHEVERLRQALEAARAAAEGGVRLAGANQARHAEPAAEVTAPDAFVVPQPVDRAMPPYRRAVFPVESRLEPHEAPVGALAALATRIVETEGPVHLDEIARRVAASFGRGKGGRAHPAGDAARAGGRAPVRAAAPERRRMLVHRGAGRGPAGARSVGRERRHAESRRDPADRDPRRAPDRARGQCGRRRRRPRPHRGAAARFPAGRLGPASPSGGGARVIELKAVAARRGRSIFGAMTYQDPRAFLYRDQLTPEAAARLTADALASADDGELYLQYRRAEAFGFDDGRLKTANYDTHAGFGLRAVSGEMTAFAHANELSEAAIKRAAETMRLIDPSAAAKAPPPRGTNRRLYTDADPLDLVPFADKVALCQRIDAAARARDPRVAQVSVGLSGTWSVVEIVRPDGFTATDVRPLVRLNIQIVVERDGRRETGTFGMGGRYLYDRLFDEAAWNRGVDEALRQALVNLESVDAPAGEMTVLLGPGWPGVLLHEAIGHGLEGDFNRKGTSAFSGRIGDRVAAPGVTVVDDGAMADRRGSLSIDDEGTPTGETILIEDGFLKGYMQDRLNARLMGVAPTGNGRRESFAHAPMPRMTNTFMKGGRDDPAELLSRVKKGIFAKSFGGGQVDIVSGKFVFSCTEAYRVEDGRLGAPIKGATLIGDGPTALTKVTGIGNDFALDEGIGVCGKAGQSVPAGVGQPTLLLEGLTVGGTAA